MRTEGSFCSLIGSPVHSFHSSEIILGITTGDPAGIGPEVSLKAALDEDFRGQCKMVLFGDANLLRSQAAGMGIPWRFDPVNSELLRSNASLPDRGIFDVPAGAAIVPGRGSLASGASAAANIERCFEFCRDGRLSAMVTAPLNKRFFNEAGFHFPGHTEFLAHLAGIDRFAMAFLSDRLKLVLATIHVPLRLAIESITPQVVLEKLEILLREFPRLGLECRRVAVAGLNPHAGEGGLLGKEETERILPALERARALHPEVSIEGPVPADTLFHRAAEGEFDAVLALYHDQGLIPIKLLSFGEAVNVTLGLPFPRTSVDHGTAYEIAGAGRAHPGSMLAAMRWAVRLSRGLL
jgi:4-hydroxythreonine-4-phosphate dehydrogenase